MSLIIGHPYYPQDLPIPGYVPNLIPLPILVGAFGALLSIFGYTALALARSAFPRFRLSQYAQLKFGWFVLCGFLHCFFEGYYVINHATIPGGQGLFDQLWKEYALSDSRYITSDPFMLCMETVTALVWGPLCFVIAYSIARCGTLRRFLQALMCIGHLYGVALYYGTSHYEYVYRGVSHSRPEFLYYCIYYVGLNAPWVVLPTLFLIESAYSTYRSSKVVESVREILQTGKHLRLEEARLEARKEK